MDVSGKASEMLRVVILSHRAELARSVLKDLPTDRLECVRVCSPYEAAAELLAAPSLALLIDLRMMGLKHVRLIEIARQMKVRMLGVGPLPIGMSAEDFSGVKLLSHSDLLAEIWGLYETAQSLLPAADGELEPIPEGEGEPAPQPEPEHIRAETRHEKAPPARLTPKRQAEADDEQTRRRKPKVKADRQPAAKPQKKKASAHAEETAGAGEPSGLLTPEELAALLENEL